MNLLFLLFVNVTHPSSTRFEPFRGLNTTCGVLNGDKLIDTSYHYNNIDELTIFVVC